MTLIDTSAWIEFLRRDGNPEVKRAVAMHLENRTAAYTCPVLYELFVGASAKEAAMIEDMFSFCERKVFTPECWRGAADLGQKLIRRGVTAPPGDVQIAFIAIEAELPLLCRDRHFDLIQEVVGSAIRVRQLGRVKP